MRSSVRPSRNPALARRASCGGWKCIALIVLGSALAGSGGAQQLNNLFFLHHSTGNGLIVEGDMRGTVQACNAAYGTHFEFWDHGYSSDGLRNAAGEDTGVSYGSPTDNTNPDGLHYIFTSSEAEAKACRDLILGNHQVIAFKSCFPASEIPDADTLNQYKTWYLEMRSAFDQRPDKLFVVMSTPPLHRLATSVASAAYARQFANWLKSSEYVSGHPNVVCFDLFNYLAGTDNFLKYEYEGSHADTDSHPNALANQTVGPVFAEYLMSAALDYSPADPTNAPVTPPSLTIRANGATDQVTVYHPDPVSITVETTAGSYAGTAVDWWALAYAIHSGEWYYLDSATGWTPFSGDLAFCRPAYQSPLFDLPSTTVLNEFTLGQGTYLFYFAVDLMDDVLNYPAGPILYATVTVAVE